MLGAFQQVVQVYVLLGGNHGENPLALPSGAKLLDEPGVNVFHQDTVLPGVVEDLAYDTVASDAFGQEQFVDWAVGLQRLQHGVSALDWVFRVRRRQPIPRRYRVAPGSLINHVDPPYETPSR